MARIDNLKSNQLAVVKKDIRRASTTNALDSGSVDNGHTTYRGNESLRVIGSALISGWLIITGTLKLVGSLLLEGVTTATGTTNLNGPVNIAGLTTVTGNSDFNGIVNIDGDLGVNGNAYLRGNVSVDSGGKIVVAGPLPMTLGLVGGRAVVSFPGGTLASASDRIQMENGSALLGAAATSAVMLFGTYGILANSTGVNLAIPTATTAVAANLVRNASGYLQISSSSERYKLAIEPMDVPASILDDVQVKTWFDRGDSERTAALVGQPRPYTREQQESEDVTSLLRRTPGVIAEEVLAAGGESVVTFDANGDVGGVAKDLLAILQIAVLKERVAAQGEELAELRLLVEKLAAA